METGNLPMAMEAINCFKKPERFMVSIVFFQTEITKEKSEFKNGAYLHNVNPIEWLTYVFENINDHKINAIEELQPQNYAALLQKK